MNGIMLPGKKSRTPKQATAHILSIQGLQAFRFKALPCIQQKCLFLCSSSCRINTAVINLLQRTVSPVAIVALISPIFFCVMFLNEKRFAWIRFRHYPECCISEIKPREYWHFIWKYVACECVMRHVSEYYIFCVMYQTERRFDSLSCRIRLATPNSSIQLSHRLLLFIFYLSFFFFSIFLSFHPSFLIFIFSCSFRRLFLSLFLFLFSFFCCYEDGLKWVEFGLSRVG